VKAPVEPTDPFDIVRRLYRAINARDLDAVGRAYADGAIAEQVFDGTFIAEGREAIVEQYRALLATWPGRVDVRTIGGIQTGWGWAQADWIEKSESGDHRAGHSHFLIENGRIRRHRRVITARGPEQIATLRPQAEKASRRYPSRPIIGIGAVILIDGAVVLIRRRHEPLAGHWTIPGGTLDLGETLESGAAREALEETGLLVDVGPVIEVFDRILLDDAGKVRYHFAIVDYLCRRRGGELRAGSDAIDIAVAKPDDLGSYHLAAKAHDVIRKALHMEGSW
jgi:ADP-ribose pyrophosphatase YjhB (NUDIX family)